MSATSNFSQQVKRILRESTVIIASVLLALFANEWRSNVKSDQETQVILENIQRELTDNQRIATNALGYHQTVFDKIEGLDNTDTLANLDLLNQWLFEDYYFADYKLATNGIMREGFNSIAWVVAKEEKLATRIPFEQSQAIYEAYHQQQVIEKTLDRITELLFQRETHRASATRENVVLMGLLFHELVAQERQLIQFYQEVAEVLGK